MLNKKLKKILLVLLTFIGACFYLIGNSISEGISSISGRKPAELKIKVTKRNSKAENMYIDREANRIFYFFGNEGLINGDFVNITEKPSDPNFISKTLSKISGNTDEIRVSNYGESKNLKYSVKKGEIKNRAIIKYLNRPKNIYVEFYDVNKKLKKIVKNDFKDIKIENIYGNLNEKTNEIELKYNKEKDLNNDLKDLDKQDKIEIFSDEIDGEKVDLKYTINEINNQVGVLKINLANNTGDVYIAVFTNQGELKKIYRVKPRILKVDEFKSSYITWNAPIIDITAWDRKDIPKNSKMKSNTEFSYGTEKLPNGEELPYIDIKMGRLLIPTGQECNKVSITSTNNKRTTGHVLLSNIRGEKLSGRVYLTTTSQAAKEAVKGLDYNDIVDSTSTIEFLDNETKEADIRLRLYDSSKNLDSLFVAGILNYIENSVSTSSIDIGKDITINYVEKLPKVEILDLRDDLKENIFINKKTIDLSEEIGKNIGDNIVWDSMNSEVDIKLAEIELQGFQDKTGKIKNPYLEILTDNQNLDKKLISGQITIIPMKYFLKVVKGNTKEIDAINYGNEKIGYKKISATSMDGKVSPIKADAYVKISRKDFEALKTSTTDTIQFKASESNLEEISITFNEDYAEKILKVPYNDFKIYKVNTDRKNNVVNLDGTIFFNEIKENKIDLVFDSTKNSTGKIGIRGISQLINSQLNDLSGNSVFDMTNGIISREYSDTDVLSLESPEGITEFKQTTAKPSVEGYQSATFKARNMEFELKIWNNTNKIELKVLKGSSSPQEGEISGVIKQKDENGDIHNTINLNLYSSTRVISMDGDSLKIWRNYSYNSEWNTEVEIVNTTDNNSTPTGEGGLKSRKVPFLSYKGDEVTLEPIKRGQEGIEERSIKFLEFTDTSKNLGTLNGKKLIFDKLGQGSVRLELTLTKDLIESLFPQDKNHTTYKDVEVAEIVFGKGKRRVPVKVRIQLRYIIPNVSDNSTPVRVISEHSKKNYYNMGLYPKEKTIKIKDITPGSEREIATITPETTTVSGIIPEIGGTKEFRGKNIKTDIQVTIGSGTLNNAGIYLGDIILNDKSQLFGVFTMIDGTQEIKEYEIWIPKYSPIQETESITSDFITNKNGNPNTYTKSLSIIRYNEDDYTTSIGVKELLGKISLLGKTKDRASDIKRNSSTLNIAKLPDSIKLIGQDTSLTEVIGHLSFSDDKIQLDAEQLEGVDKELSIYLFISSEEAKKLIPNEEYEIKGEFLAGRISNGSVSGSNLLYYGLKTDNTSDLGLDEYLYEPVFNLNIKTNTLEKKLLRIDLDNGKPLLKSKGIEKTMRILKGEGKYSIDVEGSFNYSEIKTSGMMNKYNPKREEFENKNHEVRVTDISTGKVFKGEVNSKGGSINVETDIANLELVYSDNSNLTIGMDTKDSLEILNIGISEYKLKKGDIKLLIEHLDSEAPFNVITKDEINIKIPDFEPKKWYLSSQSSIGNNEKLVGKLTNFSSNNLYFEIGEIKLKKIDKEITKSILDSEGLRIEYDSSIELTKKDDPNIKIQGKIVQIDLNGSVLNGNALKTDGKLAILIDKTQEGYNQNSVYTYDQGSMDLSSETTNKPIRIGVNGNWHGLIKNIEILPVKNNEAVLTKWNSGLVDISDWTRKAKNSSLNTNVSYGTEVFTSGVTVPYVDVQMGEILILSENSANTIRIKRLKNDDKIGSVILQKEDGKNITGKIYLKTSSSGGIKPVKGYNNKDIPDSVSNIIFSSGENKIAQVYLRIYDINENEKSLITAGKLSYLKSVYSSIDIEILENNSLILTDSTIPEVEILDLRDTLKEKIRMNKISMDFTGEIGSNIADDVVWVLGSRYVDLKLMNFSIENMVEKTGKLKNPSVNIDTVNEVPNYVLQGDSQSYDIFRYYSKINTGKTVEIDEIKHAGITLGYKKISAISDSEENLSEISGDVYIRVTREVYEELKKDSSKIFKLKRKEVVPSEKNGESAELEIVFNEDYPEQSVKVPYGDFKTIKEESDREGNTVDLKTL
ncbi:hypothetical protein, partial [Cetobacterium sp.]|uniref:hypothetical protein n=1 Tax=Cetobacterium sp. TaxID=2071632 RepID=UPI003F35D427